MLSSYYSCKEFFDMLQVCLKRTSNIFYPSSSLEKVQFFKYSCNAKGISMFALPRGERKIKGANILLDAVVPHMAF
jgi:hypothetical protein